MENKKISDLHPHPKNPRLISDQQLSMLDKSIKEFGDLGGFVFNVFNNKLVGAHQRTKVFPLDSKIEIIEKFNPPTSQGTVSIGWVIAENGEKFSYREVLWDEVRHIAASVAANKHGGIWDYPTLSEIFNELDHSNIDMDLLGFNNFEIENIVTHTSSGASDSSGSSTGKEESRKGNMSKKFIFPPFSVLNAREGLWQDRKREWLGIGLQSGDGRDDTLLGNKSRESMGGDYDLEKGESAYGGSGTSIFDPVLCELAYRWFSPSQGMVLDPFAGGSVRGIVAQRTGRQYIGIDLRSEQVNANRDQARTICIEEPQPVWQCGDSRNILDLCKGVEADFVFSCPPYADLEVYSDDPQDLSTLPYEEFLESYREIIKNSCALLKENRFACFVVVEVRDKKGHYYDFVGDTVKAFTDAGLHYYNEMILVTAVGSLPLRAGKTFSASRKIGKTHQNVLVFLKGDAKKAVAACGEVEVPELEDASLGVGSAE